MSSPAQSTNKPVIVVDFDGVLFNVRQFKKHYKAVFAKFGVPDLVYEHSYKHSKTKEKDGCYRSGKHLLALKRFMPSPPIVELNRAVEKQIKLSPQYIYKEAKDFLRFFQKKGHSVVLLSIGSNFQKKKILHSGLAKFFKKIIVINQPFKSDALLELQRRYNGNKIIFIDDSKEIVDDVKTKVPTVFAIHLCRIKSAPQANLVDSVAGSLKAAQKIIVSRLV